MEMPFTRYFALNKLIYFFGCINENKTIHYLCVILQAHCMFISLLTSFTAISQNIFFNSQNFLHFSRPSVRHNNSYNSLVQIATYNNYITLLEIPFIYMENKKAIIMIYVYSHTLLNFD